MTLFRPLHIDDRLPPQPQWSQGLIPTDVEHWARMRALAVTATWREIASVGAYVLAYERFQRIDRMRQHADDYCGCEQDKACKYHEMWQAGEPVWR